MTSPIASEQSINLSHHAPMNTSETPPSIIKTLLGSSTHTARFLIIEDDDVDREKLQRYINKYDFPTQIETAKTGQEAIQKVRKGSFDLALLDYQLGDMTGTDFLSFLKNQNIPTIPTIMITGAGNEKIAVEAMRLGVFDYISKHNLNEDSLAGSMASALHSASIERELQDALEHLKKMSLYDSLTGLPNRNLLFDRLNQSILISQRNNTQFAVLMIDLNLFKEINDGMGHKAGDIVLKEVGVRLQAVSRKSDTHSRLGGDEFCCILQNVDSLKDITVCIDKIIDEITRPILVEGKVVKIGGAIGVARYPDHGTDSTTLLSNADQAMYNAKRNHRKFEIYAPQLPATPISNKSISVTHYLHDGIKNNELFLEYQPKISLVSQTLIGAEALVRWNSPALGRLMPGSFISIAERSNLIKQITYQTIELSFKQWNVWYSDGYVVPLSINISARMLDDKSFPNWLMRKSTEFRVFPNVITLEITETALASSNADSNQVLGLLCKLGYKLSIDDFGSGFTSFRVIRDVNISELKIDRLFIDKVHSNRKDKAIVLSMIQLANSLGIYVVAEGIETEQQLSEIKSLGCEYAQGYAISYPLSANDLVKWVECKI